MSDSSPGQHGRKKYESHKTLAQIWTTRGIIIGVVVLVGIVLYNFGFTVYLLFAKPDKDGPLIWASTEGIAYSKDGGEPTGLFKLPASQGETVQNPRFNIVNGRLVYYNPETQMLCVATATDQPRWISLEGMIGPEATIRDIRPAGSDAVYLVAYNKTANPDELPSPVSAMRYAFGAAQATTMDPHDAIYGPNQKTIVRTANGFTEVVGAFDKVVAWDYDFSSNTLFVSEGKSVSAVSGATKNEFGLGPLYFIRNVSAQGGEVWLDVVKPFRSGHLLMSYGPDGSFRKLKIKDKSDIRPPYIKVTPEILELLNKVSGGVVE